MSLAAVAGDLTATRFLSMRDVKGLVTVEQSIAIQSWAFQQLSLGRAWNTPNAWVDARFAGIPIPTVGKIMSGGMEPDWLGLKFAGARSEASQNKVDVQILTLFQATSLQPVAVMEASYLGMLRTGAVAALGTLHLARKDAATLGIIGAGPTARAAVLAHSALPGVFAKVYVHSRSKVSRERFARELSAQSGMHVEPMDNVEDVVRAADVLVTATASDIPVLNAEWVTEGTHVNAIGSRKEIDPVLFGRASIVVDDPEIALRDGKTASALSSGALGERLETKALADIVAGRVLGRRAHDEITILDSSGLAIQDIAMGRHVLDAAVRQNIGATYDLYHSDDRF